METNDMAFIIYSEYHNECLPEKNYQECEIHTNLPDGKTSSIRVLLVYDKDFVSRKMNIDLSPYIG